MGCFGGVYDAVGSVIQAAPPAPKIASGIARFQRSILREVLLNYNYPINSLKINKMSVLDDLVFRSSLPVTLTLILTPACSLWQMLGALK